MLLGLKIIEMALGLALCCKRMKILQFHIWDETWIKFYLIFGAWFLWFEVSLKVFGVARSPGNFSIFFWTFLLFLIDFPFSSSNLFVMNFNNFFESCLEKPFGEIHYLTIGNDHKNFQNYKMSKNNFSDPICWIWTTGKGRHLN